MHEAWAGDVVVRPASRVGDGGVQLEVTQADWVTVGPLLDGVPAAMPD